MANEPHRPWPPDAGEILSNPILWARLPREEAVRLCRQAPVAVVHPVSGWMAASWFGPGNPFYSGQASGLHAARYFLLRGGMPARNLPRGHARKRDEVVSEPEPLEPLLPEPEYWTEIEMIDEEGVPAQGVRYQAELPDGSLRRGTLDAAGRARIESPVDGPIKVIFPELDGSSYRLE